MGSAFPAGRKDITTMSDIQAQIALGGTLVCTLLIRIYYQRKSFAAAKASGVTWKEGRLNQTLRALAGLTGIVLLAVYIIDPKSLAWAGMPLPGWLRWAGLATAAAAVGLLWWVQVSLGRNFSGNLHVLDDHRLVTHGPYRWVRHPMYSVFYLLIISWFLISANLLIGGLWIGVITLVVLYRLGREEQVMIETFGDEYRAYIQRTGRLLPRKEHI
jgi:protein-S-isoprenylcysteine O-methyltransferase Ste14